MKITYAIECKKVKKIFLVRQQYTRSRQIIQQSKKKSILLCVNSSNDIFFQYLFFTLLSLRSAVRKISHNVKTDKKVDEK